MRPRKKPEDVRDRMVNFRLTQAEYEAAAKAAKADGRPLANWLSRLVAREVMP